MKSYFPWAWLAWAREKVCLLIEVLPVGGMPRRALSPRWIRRHQIKAPHNMAAFSSVEVGHLSSTSACLLKPWGNLLFLRLLPAIKFSWSWIMHLKVARRIHTGTHTLHVSIKSPVLQEVTLRPLRIKFWGSEKDGYRAADQQIASRWIKHGALRISATEKVLREGQSLRKEDEDKKMVLERI